MRELHFSSYVIFYIINYSSYLYVYCRAQKELDKIKALPKFEDLTLEMYYDMFPQQAFDPVNRPTFWPHTPEEQPGYKTPEQKAMKEGKN